MNPQKQPPNLLPVVQKVCARIAPTWPLDQFIAVNPHWGRIDQPIEAAGARLTGLGNMRLTMPRAYYMLAWSSERIQPGHLQRAIEESGEGWNPDALIAALYREEAPSRLPLVIEALPPTSDRLNRPSWRRVVTHQISKFCAAYFDSDLADWQPHRDQALYPAWREYTLDDHSTRFLTGERGLRDKAKLLPTEPLATIGWCLERLGLPEEAWEDYLEALLLNVVGWASWCAYLRFQAQLQGRDDDHLEQFLAVRVAWEWLLDDGSREPTSWWRLYQHGWSHARTRIDQVSQEQSADWVWQRALEVAYQQDFLQRLTSRPRRSPETARPALQAVFCIDVRSEIYRRALEQVVPDCQTLGVGGFYILPIAYTPIGTDQRRPQLPGPLAPQMETGDSCGDPQQDAMVAARRRARLAETHRQKRLTRLPGSAFNYVEAAGPLYFGKLLKAMLPSRARAVSIDEEGVPPSLACRLQPRLLGLDDAARVQLAERVLRTMGLVRNFARWVVLAGHGSQSANNPHAAGLDCGACGGQTGEVNVRVLVDLLNDPRMREGLAQRGIDIAADTRFVAALHNTTTDDVALFDIDALPASHRAELPTLRQWLHSAGERTRAERAPLLGLAHLTPDARALHRAVQARANDWSQTRPEWGLANNAAFIIGPRHLSAHASFDGRCFLHDYDWRDDADATVLEVLMTAPMVVTHWINMQYYVSTVDSRHYGSGNKVLHNVVGGRIGVFEGNNGDLRIGLPLQSLHDGNRWMHETLRLTVLVAAPRAMIEAVLQRHQLLRDLFHNRWLWLWRCDDGLGCIEAYGPGGWQTLYTDAQESASVQAEAAEVAEAV